MGGREGVRGGEGGREGRSEREGGKEGRTDGWVILLFISRWPRRRGRRGVATSRQSCT